ncbi:hypothetical protein STEG23_022652, partial [Scotinomys teguina]
YHNLFILRGTSGRIVRYVKGTYYSNEKLANTKGLVMNFLEPGICYITASGYKRGPVLRIELLAFTSVLYSFGNKEFMNLDNCAGQTLMKRAGDQVLKHKACADIAHSSHSSARGETLIFRPYLMFPNETDMATVLLEQGTEQHLHSPVEESP